MRALKGASFACLPGEVHALMGENGAGKSTVMRIHRRRLEAGRQRDPGRRQARVRITGPRHAQDLGIAMVYQDTRLVPDLDVAQNIWLGREPGGPAFVDRRAMEGRARAILDRLGFPLDLARPLRELTVAERQIVEIARPHHRSRRRADPGRADLGSRRRRDPAPVRHRPAAPPPPARR